MISKHKDTGQELTLVVVIDDLDRCSQAKIVQMLEAMHLLLSQVQADSPQEPKYAPVIILLAVDSRIIHAAVEDGFGTALRDEVIPLCKIRNM